MTARLGVGQVLSGRYKVERILGEGGMGAVYLVSDSRLPKQSWAIKEMTDTFSDPGERAEAQEAFKSEAELLSQLKHVNLPRITDSFVEAGRQYLVMDYVEGETLERVLQKRGRLSVGEALDVAVQVAEVLEYLHGRPRPVIFRDLKPANVILSPDGTARLIDFGIARFFQSGKTADTRALGTPGYAAPEQYGRGQSDARTDLYALGATLHEALSGVDPAQEPFRFAPLRTLNPEVPEALEGIVARAVALSPEERFPDAAAFRRALEEMRHLPEAFAKLPERLRTGPLPPPPFNRFEPERLELGRHRYGETIRSRVLLRGAVDGTVKGSDPWILVSPGKVQGRDVPLEVTVQTTRLGMGGRHTGSVLYQGSLGRERLGLEVEVEPARVGCWAMPLAFLLTLGAILPGAGLVTAALLWVILFSTPRHERAPLWIFVISASLLSLVSSTGGWALWLWLSRSGLTPR